MLNWDEIFQRAFAFSSKWKNFAGLEKQHDHQFITEFLACFGVNAEEVGVFQDQAGHDWIDYLWPGMLGIEMKSPSITKLSKAKDQLFRYLKNLKPESVPKYLLVSNFIDINFYRLPTNDVYKFKTSAFFKNVKRFPDIAGHTVERVYEDQTEVNVKAAEKMARLHDTLKDHGYGGHELEVYLVRLLFCLFAEDTGVFPRHGFMAYVERSKPDGSDLSERLSELFEVLNWSDETRKARTLLSDELKQFRYINGGIFSDLLPSAEFDANMRRILLDCATFDWSGISPAIFGAMFQGVMSPQQRREIGAHYTSEENILKIINPLFMEELWEEFDRVKIDHKALAGFHEKISRLKFLDPACGCGNFLIITYRELRTLELEVVRLLYSGNPSLLEISSRLKVNIGQFYGFEIEDFPCQIAQVGMWLMDHQMNLRVSLSLGNYYVRFPMTLNANIVRGNALRMDWGGVVAKEELSYILGNPPFLGYSNQSVEQKEDVMSVCRNAHGRPYPSAGKIDYVAAWYYKTAQFIEGTGIRAAFVSTSSIVQGEQVAYVWKPLFEDQGIRIDFARRQFKWGNEAKGKAAVRCVIVGFSRPSVGEKAHKDGNKRVIYDGEEKTVAKNINPYLMDGPDVFIESRPRAICEVPEMVYGNKPTDGGFFYLDADGREDFLAKEPGAVKYVKQIIGAREYINGIKRYCLWLVGANPSDLRDMPLVMDRVEKVRQFRLSSKKKDTRESASTPTLFQEIRQTDREYIIVPCTSSESRKYIPVGFVSPDIVTNNTVLIVPGANLYHFGVLTSIVHMAWVRSTCGRLEVDYRYSKEVVYNNFPWPEATGERREEISALARGVLEARAQFPDSALAALYDPRLTPPPLLEAHKKLDQAVMGLYGLKGKESQDEGAIVAKLTGLYQKMTGDSTKRQVTR
jgi:hypothetical protein